MGDMFIRMENISKTFPGIKALDDVSIDINKGEVLGLVGENGAGKSTLIKILSGVHEPDNGAKITIGDKTVDHIATKDSLKSGIVVIYQDFSLFPNLTVRENIAISQQLESGKKVISWKKMNQVAAKALDELGVNIDLGARLGSLSIAKQQLVAIARALVYDAQVIVMDEPTSTLSKGEVEVLFKIIKMLKERGIGIVFITHKFEELFIVSDRITVLRDGKHVGTYLASEVSHDELIYLMVGREVTSERLKGKDFREEVLSVESISKKGNFKDVSFSVRKGEIIGITGLVGAGRTEVAHAIFGLNPPESGRILLEGKVIKPRSPKDAISLGIAYVPESRQLEGLVLRQNVESNITLSTIKSFANRLSFINFKNREKSAEDWIAKLGVRPGYPDMLASKLSGGNQQKVVVAKWLSTHPKILVVDEPTNGVDVGAKREIHLLLRKLADEGMGIVVVSSELPEVLAISDRILVMRQGRIVAEFDGDNATQEAIMNMAVSKSRISTQNNSEKEGDKAS